MTWFLVLLAITSVVWLLHGGPILLLCIPLIIGWYFYQQKAYRYLVLFLGLSGLLTVHQLLMQHRPLQPREVMLVTDRRDGWMQVVTLSGPAYVSIDPTLDVDVGDVLQAMVNRQPLAMNTYESMFNFQAYLKTKGITYALTLSEVKVLYRAPLRLQSIRLARLANLPADVAGFASEILWNRQVGNAILTGDDIGRWIGMSGLGFYLVMQFAFSWVHLKYPKQEAKLIVTLFMLPWVVTNLTNFSILRVFLLSLGETFMPNHRTTFKGGVWMGMTLIHPHYWLETGGSLYLMYQGYIHCLLPLWPPKSSWQRWGQFSSVSLVLSWIKEGVLYPFAAFAFLPLALVQVPLFLGWLMYLYTGILIPGIGEMSMWYGWFIGQLHPIQQPIYLGMMSSWLLLAIIMVGGFIILSYFLHLTQWRLPLIFVLTSLLFIHVGKLDLVFQTTVHFINVGQGDATLVVSQGNALLIDTGGQRTIDVATSVLIPYFKKLRIRQLDAVIITHDDFDHHGALPSLQANFTVHQLMQLPFPKFRFGQVMIENYHTFQDLYVDDNDRSLIIGIQWPSCQILIMGDASTAVEADLIIRNPDLKASILRVGHHGSNTSTSTALLQQLEPKVAIISLGGGNRYGHPHPAVLERLSAGNVPIRRTDLEGTIRYQTCKI